MSDGRGRCWARRSRVIHCLAGARAPTSEALSREARVRAVGPHRRLAQARHELHLARRGRGKSGASRGQIIGDQREIRGQIAPAARAAPSPTRARGPRRRGRPLAAAARRAKRAAPRAAPASGGDQGEIAPAAGPRARTASADARPNALEVCRARMDVSRAGRRRSGWLGRPQGPIAPVRAAATNQGRDRSLEQPLARDVMQRAPRRRAELARRPFPPRVAHLRGRGEIEGD